MRRQITRATSMAVAVAVLLLAVPLAVALRLAVFSDETGELERTALQTAATVSPDGSSDPVELPSVEAGRSLAVYDANGQRVAGQGPPRLDAALGAALSGRATQAQVTGQLAVALPIGRAESVVGAVRAASPVRQAWLRVGVAWAALAVLAGAALTCGGLVARSRAKRLARPLEDLARVARRVTEGDLRARAAPSGVLEIDQVSRAANSMLDALAAQLARQRDFSVDASHQLRTPLMALELSLESAAAADGPRRDQLLTDSITRARQLAHTVETVLLAASAAPGRGVLESTEHVTVPGLMTAVEDRWRPLLASHDRRLDLDLSLEDPQRQVAAVVAEVIDVLVDNARAHGRGTVRIIVREAGDDAVRIDVADEGSLQLSPVQVFERG
ncbi:MAG: HAMP domain-containing histidine kinase, partial [Actinomycetota bacterium]|nr:HAMP domain-containing histidine kinase [Actinomycetota bacterium]